MKTGWPLASIESLCIKVTSGGTPSRSNPAYYENGTIPWIKTGELKDWYVDAIQEQITEAALRESSAKQFPKDTVLLAMYGDGKTMGSVGLLRKPCATNQACCAMLTDPAKCDPKFLLYSLIYFRPAILKLTIAGAQRNLNGATIKQFKIGAPDIYEQRRIASILSAYDDLIENITRRIAILEEMARRIYEEWFVRFRFPGHEQVKMVESELGLIPEGWAVGTINDIVRLLSGFAFKSADFTDDGNYPLVTIKNVHDGVFIEDCTSRLADLPARMPKHCLLAQGDVLLSLTGNIGRCCVVTGNGYLLNQRVAKIDPIREVDRTYSYFFFRSTTTQESLSRIANGVAQQNLSPVETGRMATLIAPEKLRDSFSSLAAPIFQQMLVLRKKNAILHATRDILLPKLISGELDVSTLPVLEPT